MSCQSVSSPIVKLIFLLLLLNRTLKQCGVFVRVNLLSLPLRLRIKHDLPIWVARCRLLHLLWANDIFKTRVAKIRNLARTWFLCLCKCKFKVEDSTMIFIFWSPYPSYHTKAAQLALAKLSQPIINTPFRKQARCNYIWLTKIGRASCRERV